MGSYTAYDTYNCPKFGGKIGDALLSGFVIIPLILIIFLPVEGKRKFIDPIILRRKQKKWAKRLDQYGRLKNEKD